MGNKCTSGRWLLTVTCAIVFLFVSVYKVLSPVDIKEIIMMVVIFYFSKQGEQPNGSGKNNQA